MYRGLMAVAWLYRLLALAALLLTPVLALVGARTAALLAPLAAERGLAVAPYSPAAVIGGGLALALALYTTGALIALAVDLTIAARESADALRRIRGTRS